MDGNKPESQGLLKILLAVISGVFLFDLFLSKMRRLDNYECDDARTQDETADRTRTRQNIAPSDSFPPSNTPPEQREANRKSKQRSKIFNVKVATIVLLLVVAIINGWQLHTQIKTMKIEDRPWIAEQDVGSRIAPGKPFHAKIVLLNIGKTPALRFKIRMNYADLPINEPLTLKDIRYREEDTLNTFIVGEFNPQIVPWEPEFEMREQIAYESWRQTMEGTSRFYFFEDASYEDVFGRKLHTHFCHYYTRGNPHPPLHCEIYNDTTPE
jgi:hypothetical protein